MMKGLKAAGLEDTLGGKGPFTILAPVNLAFGNLPQSAFQERLSHKEDQQLCAMLSCYILPEKKLWKGFVNGQKLKTINNKEVTVSVANGEVRINGARILARDMQGSNGVVHALDAAY